MNRNFNIEINEDLEPAKEYVCKRIRWNNYAKDKKYNYRKQMKEYNKNNLVQELSINYYRENQARMLLLKENEKLQQKIKELQQNIKSD